MEKFENDFKTFEGWFGKIKESRVIEYRNQIYLEVDDFFKRIHLSIQNQHESKKAEVEEIFRKLKIDDLSDLTKY